jgi:hypothetical protein
MGSTQRAYSILENHVIISATGFSTFEVDGWGEGDDVLTVKRSADLATHKIGAAGEMVISLNPDHSGEITIKLQQTSSCNKRLFLMAATARSAQLWVPVEVMWQDAMRQDRAEGGPGYIKAYPELKRGREANEQEWTIVVPNLEIILGDPSFIPGSPQAIAQALGG